jgi:hypothetical protein
VQLFVTKNQVLCSEVQKNFRELCHAQEAAQFHVEAEEKALPHKLQGIDEYKFPLFFTSRQLLLMLDASLEPVPGWSRFVCVLVRLFVCFCLFFPRFVQVEFIFLPKHHHHKHLY